MNTFSDAVNKPAIDLDEVRKSTPEHQVNTVPSSPKQSPMLIRKPTQ